MVIHANPITTVDEFASVEFVGISLVDVEVFSVVIVDAVTFGMGPGAFPDKSKII